MTLTTLVLSCSGPRGEHQLADLLWRAPSTQYERETRPAVAAAIRRGEDPWLVPPEVVDLQYQLLAVTDVNEVAREVTLTGFLRLRWFDERLVFNDTSQGGCFDSSVSKQGAASFDGSIYDELWHPQVFIRNLASSFTEPQKEENGGVWLNPDGRVQYTRRQKVTIDCDMKFEWMPYDEHACALVFGTFREAAHEVVLRKLNGTGIRANTASIDGASVSDWHILIQDESSEYHTKLTGSLGTESSVRLQLVLQRKPSNMINQFVIPMVMMVIVTWATFFISRMAAPARVTLCMVSLLTVVQLLRQAQSLMHADACYTTFLESLMMTSCIFCCVALFEYVPPCSNSATVWVTMAHHASSQLYILSASRSLICALTAANACSASQVCLR